MVIGRVLSRLNIRQLAVLRLVSSRPMSFNEVKVALGIPQSTLYYDVRILEKEGLIVREEDRISLTQLGWEILKALGFEASYKPTLISKLADYLLLRRITFAILQGPRKLVLAYLAISAVLAGAISFTYGIYPIYYVFFGLLEDPVKNLALKLLASTSSLVLAYLAVGLIVGSWRLPYALISLLPLIHYPPLAVLLINVGAYVLADVLRFIVILLTSLTTATVSSYVAGKRIEHSFSEASLLQFMTSAVLYLAVLHAIT